MTGGYFFILSIFILSMTALSMDSLSILSMCFPTAILSYMAALSSTDILSVIVMRSLSLILLMSWPAILVAIILSALDILSNMTAFSSLDIIFSAVILSLSDIFIFEPAPVWAIAGAIDRPSRIPAAA